MLISRWTRRRRVIDVILCMLWEGEGDGCDNVVRVSKPSRWRYSCLPSRPPAPDEKRLSTCTVASPTGSLRTA
jgi:hypothetical protein